METLSRQEREGIVHAIDQALSLSRKKLEPSHIPFWMNALEGYGLEEVKAALMHHTKHDRREVKPADLLPFLEEQKAKRRAALPARSEVYTPAPREIETAWRWFNAINDGGSRFPDKLTWISMGITAALELDQDTQDRYLRIVNEQARMYNMPEAIPPEYRVSEVWA